MGLHLRTTTNNPKKKGEGKKTIITNMRYINAWMDDI